MRAEELPGTLGSFQVVSFGQSFHWMNRPAVAAAVRQMLEAGGAVVQVDLWHTNPPGRELPTGPHAAVPEAAIDGLCRRWLGPNRRAGRGFRNTSLDGEDAVFQSANLHPKRSSCCPIPESWSVRSMTLWLGCCPPPRPRPISLEIAWTTSSQTFAFIADLRSLLLDVSPDGQFSVALSDNRLRIRWPL